MDVRIVRDIYFPRADITYVLSDAAGHSIKSGTVHVMDTDFLLSAPMFDNSDPLHYEKNMLKDWMQGVVMHRA